MTFLVPAKTSFAKNWDGTEQSRKENEETETKIEPSSYLISVKFPDFSLLQFYLVSYIFQVWPHSSS